MNLKQNYAFLFFIIFASLLIFKVSNSLAASILPELKKSINTQCKNDDSYKSIQQCRSDVLSDLAIQGTDFIYRVQDKGIRKDMILQCNFERKNAIKFNACLFEQVAIFFGEDTTIPPPVIVEVEKDENDELVSIITSPDEDEISLIDRLIKSTFFIETTNDINSYDWYVGSAVKVNSTDLLTACHVVFDEKNSNFRENIFVSNVDHKDNQKRFKAKVKEFDLEKDACVIFSEDLAEYPSVPNIRDFDDINVYEKIYGIGNPDGFVGRTVEGKITSLYKETPFRLKTFEMNSTYFNAGEIIESNAPMDGGNSGGGIYDIYGNLIGIISICDSDLTTGQCRMANPVNYSIPASSFKNLTKFDLENDYFVEKQKIKEEELEEQRKKEELEKKIEEQRKKEEREKEKKEDEENSWIQKKDEKEENVWIEKKDNTDYWEYDNKTTINSPSSIGKDILLVKYFWDEGRGDCLANITLFAKLYNDRQYDYFETKRDQRFSFIIRGAEPVNFDKGFISKVDREYGDVSLVLIANLFKQNLFKSRFSTGGKILIDIYSLENLPSKNFSFPLHNIDSYSNNAYEYCVMNKSSLN